MASKPSTDHCNIFFLLNSSRPLCIPHLWVNVTTYVCGILYHKREFPRNPNTVYCLFFFKIAFWKYFWYYENFTQCHPNVKELELVTVWKSYLQEELTMLQYRWNEVDINCGKHSNPTKFILCSDHRNIFSHC